MSIKWAAGTGMDVTLYHVVNGLAGRAGWLDTILRWGATDLPIIFLILLGATWFWPGTAAERSGRERLAAYAVAAALLGLGVAQIIAHLWFRDRPYVHHSATLLIHASSDPSFPSDHAVGSFALAMPYLLARRRLGWILLGIAALLAIARVAVGTHYPGDVAGGAIVGAAAGWLVWRLRALVERPLDLGLSIARRLHLA